MLKRASKTMISILRIQVLIVILLFTNKGFAQTTDTLVDVGKYQLHFSIIEGKGTPIIFESGSGNDGTVWKDIIQPIAEITGATIITYDRAGLGKSEIKPENQGLEKNGILDGVEALEKGLKTLGYKHRFILVAHSFGGFYASLFSSRNEKKVSKVIFIEASLPNFYTETFLENLNKMLSEAFLDKLKAQKIGLYYEIKNFGNSLSLLRKTEFPASVPVVDMVASEPYNPLKNDDDKQRWKQGHQDFVSAGPNRTLLTINNSGHYAFRDNPILVINVIARSYAATLNKSKSKAMLKRLLDFHIKNSNKKEGS